MAEARRRDEWERLSYLRADIRNQHATKESELTHPWELNPFTAQVRSRKRGMCAPAELAAMVGDGVLTLRHSDICPPTPGQNN